MKKIFIVFSLAVLMFSCSKNNLETNQNIEMDNLKNAYFAGGCFWCMEGIFEAQDGVSEAISGYIGGDLDTANYEDVASGTTKHREAVKIIYDPEKISYKTLVEIFWRQIDPTQSDGQFADKGYQYTTAIYYSDIDEKIIANDSKEDLSESGRFDSEIVTEILPVSEFFEAEEYHQDYYKKSSLRYNLYKKGSGREDYIDQNWSTEQDKKIINNGTETDEDLKKRLTDIQYKVTQQDGTEPAFKNEYWDNKEDGIYVDIVDGTPLFSSLDKYESGTGWPSFTKPISDDHVYTLTDRKFFMTRTEVRSTNADSHLGHVFTDGPQDEGGLRYCMNSASMKFIPYDELEEKGYPEYKKLFDN